MNISAGGQPIIQWPRSLPQGSRVTVETDYDERLFVFEVSVFDYRDLRNDYPRGEQGVFTLGDLPHLETPEGLPGGSLWEITVRPDTFYDFLVVDPKELQIKHFVRLAAEETVRHPPVIITLEEACLLAIVGAGGTVAAARKGKVQALVNIFPPLVSSSSVHVVQFDFDHPLGYRHIPPRILMVDSYGRIYRPYGTPARDFRSLFLPSLFARFLRRC